MAKNKTTATATANLPALPALPKMPRKPKAKTNACGCGCGTLVARTVRPWPRRAPAGLGDPGRALGRCRGPRAPHRGVRAAGGGALELIVADLARDDRDAAVAMLEGCLWGDEMSLKARHRDSLAAEIREL